MIDAKKTEFPRCLTLKVARKRAGLTQKDLAILVSERGGEVGSIFISKFECGLQSPWAKARESLSAALGIDEEELFPEILKSNTVLRVG